MQTFGFGETTILVFCLLSFLFSMSEWVATKKFVNQFCLEKLKQWFSGINASQQFLGRQAVELLLNFDSIFFFRRRCCTAVFEPQSSGASQLRLRRMSRFDHHWITIFIAVNTNSNWFLNLDRPSDNRFDCLTGSPAVQSFRGPHWISQPGPLDESCQVQHGFLKLCDHNLAIWMNPARFNLVS